MIVKRFWNSSVNKLIVAKKHDTQAIVGYAAFHVQDPARAIMQKQINEQKKAGIKKPKTTQGCYLMRIGVRALCQKQGIGRKLIEHLLENYPAHLTLDVSTDNTKAMSFYERIGLQIDNIYVTDEQKVEFATFKTPEGFVYKPYVPRVQVVKEEIKINVVPPTEKLLQEEHHIIINEQNNLRIDFAEEIELKSSHKRSTSLGAQT